MKLSVSTNFDNELLKQLKDTPTVNVFGKQSKDVFGGGRPSCLLPEVTREQIEEHVKVAHENSLEFNYLLNGSCLNNLEFTKETYNKIFETIDWLRDIKVDWVTVTLPFLIEMIKKRAPEIRIDLSTIAYVDSVQKAKYYEEQGVAIITLPVAFNRDFKMLKVFRKHLSCDIRIMVNSTCMSHCPLRSYHDNCATHASQADHTTNGYILDYSVLKCYALKFDNPVELIKTPWIRPEDLHYYEDIGINMFKIIERTKSTEALLATVKSYENRSFDGDLMDLLNIRARNKNWLPPNFKILEESGMLADQNVGNFQNLLSSFNAKISNKKLDGFLEYFISNELDCRNLQCGEQCKHCHKYAVAAIETNEAENTHNINQINTFFETIAEGALFS